MILLIILAASRFPAIVCADSPALAGSKIALPDALSKADVIFVGEITKLGLLNGFGAEHLGYFGNKVEVVNTLYGTTDTSPIKIEIIIEASGRLNEAKPQAGSRYIFFATKIKEVDYDHYTTLKLLPASDDNVSEIKSAIVRFPAK